MIKCSPFSGSNMAPLIRASIIQLPTTDLDPRAEMNPRVCSNRLLMGLFWLKLLCQELIALDCAQMAPGRAESDFGL